MEKETFRARLIEVSASAIKFAASLVSDAVEKQMPYYLLTNASDDSKMSNDEVRYSELDLKENEAWGPCASPEDVVDFLCRDGNVPEWIDVAVSAISTGKQHLELRCCGRFTRNERLLYYKERGSPPFSVKSPTLPKGLSQGQKFSLQRANVLLRKLPN